MRREKKRGGGGRSTDQRQGKGMELMRSTAHLEQPATRWRRFRSYLAREAGRAVNESLSHPWRDLALALARTGHHRVSDLLLSRQGKARQGIVTCAHDLPSRRR
jgi:hypothetical protein